MAPQVGLARKPWILAANLRGTKNLGSFLAAIGFGCFPSQIFAAKLKEDVTPHFLRPSVKAVLRDEGSDVPAIPSAGSDPWK